LDVGFRGAVPGIERAEVGGARKAEMFPLGARIATLRTGYVCIYFTRPGDPKHLFH
jgi:hypothetical protein